MGFSDAPRLERGLAQYEADHFAILGVPLTADAKQVSEGYKRVAKALRVGFVGNSDEAAQASTLFAKWVNPAKEVLAKQEERTEYETLLQLYIRRLVSTEGKKPEELWPNTDLCEPLCRSSNWESEYEKRVAQIAESQYKSLDQVVERTSQLSELNLAYLLLKSGTIKPMAAAPVATAPAKAAPSGTRPEGAPSLTGKPFEPSPTAAPPPPENPAETRYKQALEMMERGQYKEAVQFLGFAINANPLPEYYLRRAEAYLKQGIRGMARADYQQVLRIDPNNKEAIGGLRRTDTTKEAPPVGGDTKGSKKEANPNSRGGGFLGRLFGRK